MFRNSASEWRPELGLPRISLKFMCSCDWRLSAEGARLSKRLKLDFLELRVLTVLQKSLYGGHDCSGD